MKILCNQIVSHNKMPTQGLIAMAVSHKPNSNVLIVEQFKDNLNPINQHQQQIAHQNTQSFLQTLISKVKATKIYNISFVTGKSVVSNSNAYTDSKINNYLNNIKINNVLPHLQTDANQALNFYKNFAINLRDLCENGSQEQIENFISSFYSLNNPYNAYFRGEMYNLIKGIYDFSSQKSLNVIGSKNFAYRIYKILDPAFDGTSLDNLFIYENGLNNNSFQKVHELLDAIDLARSSTVEIHLTNDNDWAKVLKLANVDSSFRLVGKLSQPNMDLLVIDRVNKVYYGLDLKTRFWLNGFPINTNHLLSLGNIPKHERIFIEASQKNEILTNLRNKLNSPKLTDAQRNEIISQIYAVSNNSVPLNTVDATLPHINTGFSKAVSAVIYSNGTPDRQATSSLGLESNIDDFF